MINDTACAGFPASIRQDTGVKRAIQRHWDRKAATFDQGESCVNRTPLIQEAWQRIFRRVLGNRGLKILDVGSGTGEVSLLFAELGHRVSGIDLAPEMVNLAERKSRLRNLPCRFQVGDAEALPFPEETFDVVHARHLLWTLPHPRAALADWIRVVRRGGKVLITESVWDGALASPLDRVKVFVGRAAAHLAACVAGVPPPVGKRSPDYPGPDVLPFHGGLGYEKLIRFLEQSGLWNVRGRDLLWLRNRGRKTVPWYRRWMKMEKKSYYLAWGTRP